MRWKNYRIASTLIPLFIGIGCSLSDQQQSHSVSAHQRCDAVAAWTARLDSAAAQLSSIGSSKERLAVSIGFLRAIEDVWPDSASRMAERIVQEAERDGAENGARIARLIGASIAARTMHPSAKEQVMAAVKAVIDLGPADRADEARLRAVKASVLLQDTSLLRTAPGWIEAKGLEMSAARVLLAAVIADTSAFKTYHEELSVALKMDTIASPQHVKAILDMSDALDREGRPDSASHWVSWAMNEAERLRSPFLTAKCKELQATIASNAGRYAEAGDHLVEALNLYHRLNARWHIPEAERKLAYVYWGSLHADTVRNRFLHAMNLADSIGNQWSACTNRLYFGKFLVASDSASLARWGISYHTRFDSGVAYLDRAYALASTLPDRWLRINILEGMGAIKNHQGDFQGSLAIGERTLASYTELGSKPWIARSMGALLPDLYSLGKYHRVLEFGERTVRLAREAGLPNVETEALIRMYWANRQLGNHKLALEQKLRVDTLQDLYSSNAAVEELARANERHKAEQQHLADSLAHMQELAVEKATAEARIQRQRTTTWAIGGVGALLLLGAGGYFLLDRKRRQAQFERDTAKLEKEAAAFETQALRSQMNPHFIFNALNSISGYIQGNEPDQAQTFLARFAKLMRAVLENSRFTEVPLAKDLEVLRAYMELERTRAQGKFDFSIEVDPALDAHEVLVPPLVAQPFVENAIWHGIAGKIGRGHITLRVSQGEGQLRIEVVDDGVGMSTRAPSPSKDKTSLGTQITRSRLDLVQKQKGKPAGYRYLEAVTGTHVEIHLPLELAA